MGEAPGPHHDWLDGEAGPVVRPYAMTAGRVQPAGGGFDLMAFVVAGAPGGAQLPPSLQPEHHTILAITQQPISVAEVASQLDLAVGVVRVLLGDLLSAGLIAMYEPPAAAELPDDRILKAVVDGLRAL
ncbi:Protein of unknown function [Micromonospora pattaloongensis]|uniref:DUF742 domain-containing protein n=1 Tax=Micromonospora pattaloongensis TaxID=405436 RepID=A0A1H3FPP3_9ACTN|nr:DUF742 domain-containing protein [Micromonospora pattaloongensis]SDX92104.1 Protein of unknown function [Micromonospora pattaloongensis]